MAETLGQIAPASEDARPALNQQPESTNKVQAAILAWRNIDMTNLVSSLDSAAAEIVTYQRDSTVQRKDLAQKTKDFRKLDDAAKLVEYKSLLKAYQTFIDLLTNHSKSINSTFLQTYTALSDAPDPYPVLEAAVDSMLVSEDTLPKLTEENQQLQTSVSKLTAQLEDTESRLQTERAARKEGETSLETKVKEVELSWTAVLDEKTDNWAAKEKALNEKLENQDRLLTELKATYEVNQRLGTSGTSEEDTRGHVTSAELDMLHSDLERTNVRLAEVQARNEQLRIDLAQAKSAIPTHQATSLEDDPGYLRMRSENSSLVRKLDTARVERESLKRDLDAKLRGFERETASLQQDRDAFKAKLQKWSDYEEVKSELEVLKSIEFSTGDDDDAHAADQSEGNGKAKGDNLEQLLLGRNKKLSEELTVLRMSHQDLQSRLQDLQENLSRTKTELETSQTLNEKLENDLAEMQSESSNMFPSGASVAGALMNRYAPSIAPSRRPFGGRSSPTSSIISGFDSRGSEREPMGGGSGILPMVTAQRDRFKKRNTQLEHELSESHTQVSRLRSEVAALQKDNLSLYEKSRYVTSYNRGPAAASSSSSYANNPNPSTVTIGTSNGGSTMDRYRTTYETNLALQPFAAFRGRESARAYKTMSLPERVAYSLTRMVLASRTSRNLFAVYCLALHLLVFLSLYWLGTAADGTMGGAASVMAAAGAGAAKAGSGSGSGGRAGWKEKDFEAR